MYWDVPFSLGDFQLIEFFHMGYSCMDWDILCLMEISHVFNYLIWDISYLS